MIIHKYTLALVEKAFFKETKDCGSYIGRPLLYEKTKKVELTLDGTFELQDLKKICRALEQFQKDMT